MKFLVKQLIKALMQTCMEDILFLNVTGPNRLIPWAPSWEADYKGVTNAKIFS